MIDSLTAKGVQVQFIKENLTFNGKDSLMANLMLSIMGAVAEFELGKIAERRDEGIVAAKKAVSYTHLAGGDALPLPARPGARRFVWMVPFRRRRGIIHIRRRQRDRLSK